MKKLLLLLIISFVGCKSNDPNLDSSSSSAKDQITVLLDGKEILNVSEYNSYQVKPGEIVRGNNLNFWEYTGKIRFTTRGGSVSDGKNAIYFTASKIEYPLNLNPLRLLYLTYNQETLNGLMDLDFTEKINGNRITATYYGTLKPSGKRIEIRVKDVIFLKSIVNN